MQKYREKQNEELQSLRQEISNLPSYGQDEVQFCENEALFDEVQLCGQDEAQFCENEIHHEPDSEHENTAQQGSQKGTFEILK